MNLREVPDNDVKQVGLFASTSEVGSTVQMLLEDSDVLGIASITPGLKENDSWFITINYAVLDLKDRQREIVKRLFHQTGDSPTFREVNPDP